MNAKRTLLLLGAIAVLAGMAYVAWYPRSYYRYGGGRVWLENDPNAVWNGLLRAPVFQFRVPPFTRPGSWKPTLEQVRGALKGSDLSEDEIARIIRSCVSCDEQQNQKSEPDGAANGSQPIRSETNRTSSAAGSRR